MKTLRSNTLFQAFYAESRLHPKPSVEMKQNEFCNITLFYWAWKGLCQIKLQLLSLSPRSLIKPDLIFPCTLSPPGEAKSAVIADLRPEYMFHLWYESVGQNWSKISPYSPRIFLQFSWFRDVLWSKLQIAVTEWLVFYSNLTFFFLHRSKTMLLLHLQS